MEKIKINGLYDKAYRAYSNLSFSPEKRAENIVKDYEEQLNEDLSQMPEIEREQYITNYNSHLFAWLGAMSNCYSVMITGGSNFNNSRHEKANNRERAQYDNFIQWRQKALNAISKKAEAAKPAEQREGEEWQRLEKELRQKIEWQSVVNFVSMVERLAYNGKIVLVEKAMQLVRDYNEQHPRQFITERNKFWTFAEIAKKKAEQMQEMSKAESKEEIINGVKIVRNFEADRLQMFFDGKPDAETISKLKHSAFKWSPSNGCCQRQLTNNAIYAMQTILKNL